MFTEKKSTTVEVAQSEALQGKAVALNGDMSQAIREQALDLFRSGHINTMVATDIAARGLGIHMHVYISLSFQYSKYGVVVLLIRITSLYTKVL